MLCTLLRFLVATAAPIHLLGASRALLLMTAPAVRAMAVTQSFVYVVVGTGGSLVLGLACRARWAGWGGACDWLALGIR
jgi:hypothetical protein